MILPHLIAPAGTPIGAHDAWASMKGMFCGGEVIDTLVTRMMPYAGSGELHFVNTGRSALTTLLEALIHTRKDAERDEILVPAYDCYSVPASVLRAGFRLRICDVDPNTLSYDPAALAATDTSRTIAILSANLYGLPNDMPLLESFAQERGLVLLDDAAQSLGAIVDGRPSGSFGAAGLFSFDKGKVVTSMQGGAVAIRDAALGREVSRNIAMLPPPVPRRVALDIAKYFVYMLVLPPSRYWLTSYMPFLRLGETRYEDDFPVTGFSPRLGALVLPLMAREPELRAARTCNADSLSAILAQCGGFRTIQPLPGVQPAWVRLPVLAATANLRERAVSRLLSAGIGASYSYPKALADVPELSTHLRDQAPTPQAREVAGHIFTLPTHPFVTVRHHNLVREILSSLGDARA